MRLVRVFGVGTLCVLLGGCAGLSLLDAPGRGHISVLNRSDYDVKVAPDGRTLLVSLDSKSAIAQKLVYAASFGTAEGPPASEFDTAASDWLKFDRPQCKAANGRRTAFGSAEYDLTCEPWQAAR